MFESQITVLCTSGVYDSLGRVCSWAHHSLLTPLLSPYFPCKAQLQWHALYVVFTSTDLSQKQQFLPHQCSHHFCYRVSHTASQLSGHIWASPTELCSFENKDLSLFIFLFQSLQNRASRVTKCSQMFAK